MKEKLKGIFAKLKEKLAKLNVKKVLIIIGIVLVALIAVIGIAVLVMRHTGKNSLYKENEKASIDFSKEQDDEELEIDMDNMGQLEGETKESATDETETETVEDVTSESETTEPGESETQNVIIQAGDDADYDITYNGEEYVYNEDIITLLVLGIDKLEKVTPAKDGLDGGQSDGVYLLVMNPHTKKIDMIAVHRDTITKLWIYDENGEFLRTGNAQICLQHGYGDGMELSNDRAKDAVSYLFYGLPIHSVSSINMGAVEELNDAIGGVTLQALESFSFEETTFEAGKTYTLKGHSAYAYVKFRDTTQHYTASKRLERQKQYLNLFIKQGLSAIKDDVNVVVDVYNTIKDYVVTDLSVDEMTYLATESIGYSFGEIYSLKGTVDTSRTYERYYLDEDAFMELIVKVFYEKKQ